MKLVDVVIVGAARSEVPSSMVFLVAVMSLCDVAEPPTW